MAKITKIEDKTYQGKVTGHIVTLSDGTNGYLADKVSDNVQVGDEVTCTIEVKKNKQGADYNLLTLKLLQQVTSATPPASAPNIILPPLRVNWSGMEPIMMKQELRKETLGVLGQLATHGKIEPKEIIDFYNDIYPALDLSVDVLFK